MKIRLAGEIQEDSIVDGEGLRTVIWTQGCSHNCYGCHNPGTHDFNGGISVDVEDVKSKLKTLKFQDGVTFSGGDPMFQAAACSEIAKFCRKLGLNVWCYTGFTFEKLLEISKTNENLLEFLKNIDVLIDGKFELSKKSLNVKYRGSTNQRIIDVKQSLKNGYVCTIKKYDYSLDERSIYFKKSELYI